MASEHGVVNFFNDQRGWGFIDVEDGRKAFVHYSNIEAQEGHRTLEQGQQVVFNIEPSDKGSGFQAVKVRTV